jgi:NAD+ diphosphatase
MPQGYGHVFSTNPLDRGEKERRTPEDIAVRIGDASSRFLLLKNSEVLISNNPTSKLAWLGINKIRELQINITPIFLGILNDSYHYALSVSDQIDSKVSSIGLEFIHIRDAGALLELEESAIAGYASMQMNWHHRHKFCPSCGSPTTMKRAGQVRKCTDCTVEHFPRTDPVIIVIVHDGEKCLLGQSRGRLQNTNTYSALAGFVDQGESIEEAVAREVMEEAGISVKNVTYHSSQPWPLPYSLMIGCHAEAASTEINMDPEEMTDVKWFTREEVIRSLESKSDILKVPMKIAIAHHLLKDWAYNNI